MKKRLILGFSLITLVFILSGSFVYSRLHLIAVNQNIARTHAEVRDLYTDIENEMSKLMLALHAPWIKTSNNNARLMENIRKSEDMLSRIRHTYSVNKHNPACNKCHGIPPKHESLDKNLAVTLLILKEKLILIAANNEKPGSALEQKTEELALRIINDINLWGHAAREINRTMREDRTRANTQSRLLILITIALSSVLSVIIIYVLQRSILTRTRKLSEGIQKAAAGDYDTRIDAVSDDELGLLARNFNYLIENLKKTIQERDVVTRELMNLNCNLEQRISQKTEKLRIAHDNLVRTEGLAVAGTFASKAAHDLSSPLSTLAGYCQLINRKVPEEFGVAPYCNMMEKEIEKCMRILTGILDYVRTPDDEKSPTDINALITELLLFVSLQADCKNVSVIDNMDPSIAHIVANPLALRQVFMNIIINALQAMPDGGELRISTSVAEDSRKVHVIISDTGHGISESDKEKIFNPFYTTKKSGTGLGLSISYGIIKSHGGDITIGSELGRGTTFIISLPLQDHQATRVPREKGAEDFKRHASETGEEI